MQNQVSKAQTPEDQELKKKLAQLSELESKLTRQELDLATLKGKLRIFETKYMRVVGLRLAKLDEIEARISEAMARLKPEDEKIGEKATQARAQAKKSAKASGAVIESAIREFKPSEDLRNLYREVAKLIHPDLSVDKTENARRQKLMAEANQAYEEGNEAKLREIINEWENSPEFVDGEGTAAELVRTIRKIAQIQNRLHAIQLEIAQLKNLEMYHMKIEAEIAEKDGRNLLGELAEHLDRKIASAKKRLFTVENPGFSP